MWCLETLSRLNQAGVSAAAAYTRCGIRTLGDTSRAAAIDHPLMTRAHYEEIDYWLEACADFEDDPIHRVQRWSLQKVPIDAFGCTFSNDELGRRPDLVHEADREEEIKAWVADVGSWDEALRRSPVIAIRDESGYDKVDGWHRLKLAKSAGLTHVWCLVGEF